MVEQTPVVTTPTDYEESVDLTIRQFSFTPFGVFGFSPFQVFGFSPFSVFGFSPFNVFGFSPFRVFGFSPSYFGLCIDEQTPVLTKKGYILAKDIVSDDILITKTFDSIPITDHEGLVKWNSENNKEYKTIESKITNIKKSRVSSTVIINKDKYKRFSLEEDILIIKDDRLKFVMAKDLKKGDLIVKDSDEGLKDGPYYNVEEIEIILEDRDVYDFMREPFGLIVADSLFVYNAYPETNFLEIDA